MQAGLETFNQHRVPRNPAIPFTLAKVLLFGKAAPFFAKKAGLPTDLSVVVCWHVYVFSLATKETQEPRLSRKSPN